MLPTTFDVAVNTIHQLMGQFFRYRQHFQFFLKPDPEESAKPDLLPRSKMQMESLSERVQNLETILKAIMEEVRELPGESESSKIPRLDHIATSLATIVNEAHFLVLMHRKRPKGDS